MGSKPRDNRVAVKVPDDFPIVAPYADAGDIYTGQPSIPVRTPPMQKSHIVPAFYDIRDVPVLVGFDFRKPVIFGC